MKTTMENTLTTKDYIILDLMNDEYIRDYEFLTQYGEMYDKLRELKKEVKHKHIDAISQINLFIGATNMANELLGLKKRITVCNGTDFCWIQLLDEDDLRIGLKHSQMFDRKELQSYTFKELNEAILSQLNNINNWAEGWGKLPYIQNFDDAESIEVVPENFDVYKKNNN